jgi:CubicO group peptidase (beta-lactamase class C family)
MDAGGWVEPGFEPVRQAFVEVLRGQRGTGAAVAAWHGGRWVADLWGGRADSAGTRPWQADSLVQAYSVGKAFAAVAALATRRGRTLRRPG